jgi:hypothetical protein
MKYGVPKMSNRAILLIACIVLLIAAGISKTTSLSQQQPQSLSNAEKPGTLKWHALKAKSRGERRTVVPAPISDFVMVRSLDEAASHFNVFVAHLIDEKVTTPDSRNIVTWYKFRVVEDLSRTNLLACRACASPPNAPAELLPLQDDEILTFVVGGTTNVDDVQITMVDKDFPHLSTSKDYLIFLRLEPVTKTGRLVIGPSGIFAINPDNTLTGVNDKQHPLKRDIGAMFGNSLDQLKSHLNSKKHSIS